MTGMSGSDLSYNSSIWSSYMVVIAQRGTLTLPHTTRDTRKTSLTESCGLLPFATYELIPT